VTKKRSGFEDKLDADLKDQGCSYWYEPFKIPYEIKETRNYIPDFVISKGKLTKPKKSLTFDEARDMILIEAKGFFKYQDRVKMLLVKEQYPELDVRLVFQNNNYITKLTKKQKSMKKEGKEFVKERYSDWAEKHGFPYAIKQIPSEWYKEG
jgi:hypothetical protein